MNTTLTLNEKQCKMLINALKFYSDMIYRVYYDTQDSDVVDLYSICDQIPKEYFEGLILK